jgi:two-component system, chemotaxis family, chemotaxis protein CheY
MGLNILVVDDSGVMRAMIIKTLKMCGVEVGEIFQAANGEEGLSQLEKNWADLVLVDINMPVMGGEEMIDRMRQNTATRDIPVVVVSTESSQSRIEMLEKKSSGFVHKPFNPEIIKSVIDSITGGENGKPERKTLQGVSPDF